jgi:hypothetical protein
LPVKDHPGTDRSQAVKSSVKRFATLAVFFLLLSLLAVNTHSPAHALPPVPAEVRMQQDPASVIATFDAALNAHNVDGALHLFTDNAIVRDGARETYTWLTNANQPSNAAAPTCRWLGDSPTCNYDGPTQIQEWLQQLTLAENIQVQATGNYLAIAENVTWTLAVSIDAYRSLNVAPLLETARASLRDGKIQSLVLELTTESTAKLEAAVAKGRQGSITQQIVTGGFLAGLLSLGLILPAVAVYYISKVRSLFAAVPRLERPWFLLLGGVACLFIALLLLMIRYVVAVSIPSVDMVQYLFVVLTGAFILAAMVLMKRVWTIPSGE